MRASALAKSPLQMAARANALCMVVRSHDWVPMDGDVIKGCNIKPENLEEDCSTPTEAIELEENTRVEILSIPENSTSVMQEGNSTGSIAVNNEPKILIEVRAPYAHYAPKTKLGQLGSFMLQSYRFRAMPLQHQLVYLDDVQLHGLCQLPPGYTLCFVPPHMSVRPRRNPRSGQTSSLTISSQFSALQVLWSITQTCIGSYTLYKSRGAQLDIYGYAAFGLTVIPYVTASIINLLASLVSRQYDDVFLIHSEIMDEAIARGGWVDGVVGTVDRMDDDDESMCEDDELGKIGNTSLTFRSTENENGQFKCEATSADGSSNYLFEPVVSIDLSAITKTQKLQRHIKNIILDPAEAERKLAKKRKKENKDQCRHIVIIPSHGPFARLPSTHLEPLFLFLATALLIAAVTTPYIIIYILTGWKKQQATSNQSTFTIHWLILGQTSGLTIAEFERHTGKGYWGWILLFVVICYSVSNPRSAYQSSSLPIPRFLCGNILSMCMMADFWTCSGLQLVD
ncbi:hypothetical protein ACMFMF_008834 [Clarireedia jacksonii]